MNKIKQKINIKTAIWWLIPLLGGLLLGWILFRNSGHSKITETSETSVAEQTETPGSQIWTCAMHPQIRMDHPGHCPICGMELIPADNVEVSLGPDEFQMSQEAVKLAEVETYTVKRTRPEREIYLNGKVKADERLISSQTAHIPGRIEELYISFTGEEVHKGQPLVRIYSPELVTAQEELFEAKKYAETNPSLLEAARNKLKLWKLRDDQIEAIEKSGKVQTEFDIRSDFNGIITERLVSVGDYVNEGTVMYQVEDLRHVWVLFEAYESDLPWIKLGDKVEFTIHSLPGRTFNAKITFIDPVIDPMARVAYVRAELNNPGLVLKPDMFANGIIHAKLPFNKEQLIIPKSSVLWTGKRSLVYVYKPDYSQPTFELRQITLGPDAGDYYIITEGLNEGEEVVSRGEFKIDAAAQLSGKKSMMNPEGGKMNLGHHHGNMEGMDMDNMENREENDESGIIETDPAFRKELDKVVNIYLEIKDYLVADDDANARNAAKSLLTALKEVDMTRLSGAAHMKWMTLSKAIQESGEAIAGSDNLEKCRDGFILLSESMQGAVELFGSGMDLYVIHCPMANNKQGANWLSQSKEIQNPFYGSKMLKCGKVVKSI